MTDNEKTLREYERLTEEQKERLAQMTNAMELKGVGLADKMFDGVRDGLREDMAAMLASPELEALGRTDLAGECEALALVCVHALVATLYRRLGKLNPLAAQMSLLAAMKLSETIRTEGELADEAADSLVTGGLFRQSGEPGRS